MRRFVSMIMISGASAITFAVAGVPFNGKKGAAQLEALLQLFAADHDGGTAHQYV